MTKLKFFTCWIGLDVMPLLVIFTEATKINEQLYCAKYAFENAVPSKKDAFITQKLHKMATN